MWPTGIFNMKLLELSSRLSPLKQCVHCKVHKFPVDFPQSKTNRSYARCTFCRSRYGVKQNRINPEKFREKRREYYHANKHRIASRKYDEHMASACRKSRLKRKYGMSEGDAEVMALAQNHCCAICGKRKPLVIDHSHELGYVRGLLCSDCNKGLGCFCDSVSSLRGAIDYLSQHMKVVPGA